MSDLTLHPHERELEDVRVRLQSARGKQFWRSLDELADTPAFHELLKREFPAGAAELKDDPVSRRTFLKLMGASFALAGLSGCTFALRQPQEKVAPYALAPHDQRPGIPNFYATAVTRDGFGLGVAVKSYDGRPIKVEGNPAHPASMGATDLFAQAEILQIYDPARPETILNAGRLSTWDQFVAAFMPVMQFQRTFEGQGLRILTPTVTSPSLIAQIDALLQELPNARWVQYDPVGRSNTYAGTREAFGEPLEPIYHLERAQTIVALDADFLSEGPGRVRYAYDWIAGRRVLKETQTVSRLYVAEPATSNTGIVADHRLPVKGALVASVAFALARTLGLPGLAGEVSLPPAAAAFVAAAAADLRQAGSAGLVIAGESQPPQVHALAHAINVALGAVGRTITYTTPVVADPADQTSALRQLAQELASDQVELLLIIDANPAYNAPADLNVATVLQQAKFKLVLGPYADETAALADWFIPMSHSLESWGDVRAFDGSVTIVQPLIEPLYGGRSPHELLALMLGQSVRPAYNVVRDVWAEATGLSGAELDDFINGSLNQGLVANSNFPSLPVTLRPDLSFAAPELPPPGLELVFRPDASVYDGRYSNNGWLQELPKPVTQLTWDNAALVSPRTAIRLLGLAFDPESLADANNITAQRNLEQLIRQNGALVELSLEGRTLTVPIWIVPGHAEDTVTLSLGYGRGAVAGPVAEGTGFNAYSLRTSSAPWFAAGLTATATNDRYQLVSTQNHWTLEGRSLIRVGEFDRFKADPKYIAHEVYREEYGKDTPGPGTDGYQSLLPGGEGDYLPGYDYSIGNQWGMSIDLTACMGCNACVVACQAENNIPIVGKREVAMGREMHWIRIDRYFAGNDFDNPETYLQPMLCQHCERAPCELVCPVAATVHDAEGLNNMIYNRCVGTKYCSNNCPYKVRRFNFFQYTDLASPSLRLGRNPEVTVRNLGVMEKCSFCIQRIADGRIRARVEGDRPITDGEVISACAQACPTQAITFGDINNPDALVTKRKAEPHNYSVLGMLNTRPRTTYLARVRNPNPDLADGG
ncbi:TAT-variant-translocated molybdopterin oxidoreductase [Candidatus Viridilinea mediisalina]|uniref:Molybdopterin oxidoreductase n=1 Tax=Candidatus Viridilinea mediisalina TaxID=2024553 RepID=A0A2A6RJH5_9CHLR|nr:TAT-variant-translocated molybdopterin oxidoreductase [Candidatus Viridilinea mediisalina]PDW03227.1 molybdopterin oxidoreductase [Candidatus Viridilinea mediisalina]